MQQRHIRVGITLSSLTVGLTWGLLSFADPPAGAVASSDAVTDDKLFAQLMAEGESIADKTCKLCHGAEGQGMVGPPLRQNVENVRGVVRVVILGNGDMPPIGSKFSDRELAAVVTYVRNSWGNKYGPVTEEQAHTLRP